MPSPRYWREVPHRYRLEAEKCEKCGKILFPRRQICPACRATEFSTVKLSEAGKVLTYTVIHTAPDDFATQTPYVVAVIETPEGARLTAQVVDCKPDAVSIGADVSIMFRKLREEGKSGILCYGYKAVLA